MRALSAGRLGSRTAEQVPGLRIMNRVFMTSTLQTYPMTDRRVVPKPRRGILDPLTAHSSPIDWDQGISFKDPKFTSDSGVRLLVCCQMPYADTAYHLRSLRHPHHSTLQTLS